MCTKLTIKKPSCLQKWLYLKILASDLSFTLSVYHFSLLCKACGNHLEASIQSMHITLNVFFIFSAILQNEAISHVHYWRYISSEFKKTHKINRNGLMHCFSELICLVAVSLFLPFLSLYLIHFSTFLKLNIFSSKNNLLLMQKVIDSLLWKACLRILDVPSLPNTINFNLLCYVHIHATVRVLEQTVNTAFFFFFFCFNYMQEGIVCKSLHSAPTFLLKKCCRSTCSFQFHLKRCFLRCLVKKTNRYFCSYFSKISDLGCSA